MEVHNDTAFDIETGPLPDGELERLFPPFDPLTVKGSGIIHREFDPVTVKLGNLKDPDKITVKLEAARKKYAVEQAAMVKTVEQARADRAAKLKDKAALKALTGRVICIGYFGKLKGISHGLEQNILLKFWEIVQEYIDRGQRLVGFNIFGFDLPFVVRRSWILGLNFPLRLIWDGRRWCKTFVDLADVYRLGCYQEYEPLKTGVGKDKVGVANGLGVTDRIEEHGGGEFARLWEEDRETARKYLIADLQNTWDTAERLGCLMERES